MSDSIGKKAERKIKEWLDHPESGYSFDRVPDQLSGFYGSSNICDFICFKSPYQIYIESKATEHGRFDFSMISDIQMSGLLKKSKIDYCYAIIIVLFVLHKRAFILDIKDISDLIESGKKSINIDKIDKWTIPYIEIPSISSRKQMLDYSGDLIDLLKSLENRKSLKGRDVDIKISE